MILKRNGSSKMDITDNKAIIYTRVSSKQQRKEGYSIPAQIKICKKYANEKNLKIVEIFEEVESAKSSGRIKFAQAIEMLESGKVKHIIVEKDDRLTRNYVDKVKLDGLIERKEISVHLVRPDKIINNNSSPEEKFLLNINTAVNQLYIDDLRQKIRKGKDECFEDGNWPHRTKMGYYRDKETKVIYPHPIHSITIKRLFQNASTGLYTLKELREQAVSEGLRTGKGGKPTLEYIRKILKDTYYYGWMRWGLNKETGKYRKEGRGNHEPLISKELYEKVQNAMRRKPEQKHNKKDFPFKEILKCKICGCPITAELKKKHNRTKKITRYYVLYHCTNSKGMHDSLQYINEKELEKQFFEQIENIELPRQLADRLAKKVNEMNSESKKARKTMIANLKRKLSNLKTEKQGLIRMKAKEELSDEEYYLAKAQIDKELLELEYKIRDFENNPNMNDENILSMIELFKHIKPIYLHETPENRAKLLNLLASNWLFDGVSVSPEWRYPFDEFIKADGFQQKWS